jgi:5'-methylthioadenosine phosphorylase
MVIVDQFFDRTSGRDSTFFGDGVAAHVELADPVSPVLSKALHEAAAQVLAEEGAASIVHRGGTYLVIDGPQFSSRGESMIYRQWGVDVIGMTNMPEAKLAREAEISYATLALATDYDCWRPAEESVSVEAVLAILRQNAARARRVLSRVVDEIPQQHECVAARALEHAILTDPARIPAATRDRLALLIGRYLS